MLTGATGVPHGGGDAASPQGDTVLVHGATGGVGLPPCSSPGCAARG